MTARRGDAARGGGEWIFKACTRERSRSISARMLASRRQAGHYLAGNWDDGAARGCCARRWRVDLQSVHKGTLAEHLGIRFVEATPERVVAELDHRPALTTVGGALHGGTLMALADTVGAAATFLNLPAEIGRAHV